MGRWGGARYPVRTNSLGFRDAEVRTVPLRGAAPRVLLIGDSFTEGLGVPYSETYAGLLDRCLHDRGVELLNAGVMSYSPSIYYRKVEHLVEVTGLKVDYVVVAIDLSDIGDEAHRYVMDSLGAVVDREDRGGRSFLIQNSVLVHVIKLAWDAAQTALAEPASWTDWTVDPRAYQEYGARGLALAEARMSQLAAFLRGRKIGLAVIVYPYPNEVLRGDTGSVQVRVWRAWAAGHRLPFFNLFPVFITSAPAAAVLTKDFIPHDVHWSAAGHRFVADALLAEGLADTVGAALGRVKQPAQPCAAALH